MLVAIVVMAIREHEDHVSSDMQYEEVGELWNDVDGRFTKID